MLITCPSCDSGYEVPDHLLAGEGRRLRCKLCAEEWHAMLPVPQEPEPALAPEPPSRPPLVAQAPPTLPQRRRLPWLAATSAWAASLILIASAGAATLHWRDTITTAWPPAQRLFHP